MLRVAFHPKQLMVLSGGDDGDVRVWDLVTKACVATLKGHFSAVTCLSLSPDGWTLLSGGRDSVVIAWNLRDYSKLATIPVYEPVEGLAALPAGCGLPGLPAAAAGGKGAAAKGGAAAPVCFATGGEKGVLKLWRADTGALLHEESAEGAPRRACRGSCVCVCSVGAGGAAAPRADGGASHCWPRLLTSCAAAAPLPPPFPLQPRRRRRRGPWWSCSCCRGGGAW